MAKNKDFSNLQGFQAHLDAAKGVLSVPKSEMEAKAVPEQQPTEAEQNKKSKRFNFMVKPATYEELKSLAEDMNVSIGSLLNLIITDYLKKRKEQ